MSLSTKEIQTLKGAAHSLKPVVILGSKGLTPEVIAEIDRALIDHELIKIKIPGQEKNLKKEIFHSIGSTLDAECVQLIGHIGVLYRKNPEET